MRAGTPSHWLAVDIGGTKVAAAIVDDTARVLAAVVEPTCQEGPAAGIRQIVRLLAGLLAGQGLAAGDVAAIGVGIPAVLASDTDRVVWAPNLAGWRDVDLREPLAAAFHLPVMIEYDGHTATLAEAWAGVGRNVRSFANIIVGTGIGGGLVLDGRLVRGVNRLAGAAGWFVVNGEPQASDERARTLGSWEAQAAGPGIALRAQRLLAGYPTSPLAGRPAGDLTASAVFDAAATGDPLAVRVLDDTATLLGRGLANVVSLVNPELIVLGGGVGSRCGSLLPAVRAVMERWAQPISVSACRLAVSTLGGEAGLLGAAYGAMLRLAPAATNA